MERRARPSGRPSRTGPAHPVPLPRARSCLPDRISLPSVAPLQTQTFIARSLRTQPLVQLHRWLTLRLPSCRS